LIRLRDFLACLFCCALAGDSALIAAQGEQQSPDLAAYLERSRQFSAGLELKGLREDFKGITTSGEVVSGLYELRSTGVSTQGLVSAAKTYLDSLDPEQRDQILFPENDVEWRKWANQHLYIREGLSFEQMDTSQRQAAFALLAESLSAKGLKLTRDIMRLNETLAELNAENFVEYGEWKYWLSLMGEPSATEPWGWQLDGHHLNLNYFVLGDQVVMTPAFWGSEPVIAQTGRYAGTMILQEEQEGGLGMMRALTPEQRRTATLAKSKTGNNILAQAFSDNLVLDFAGVRADSFSEAQRQQLLSLIELYVGNLRSSHARVRMSEVEVRLEETYFAWIGEAEKDSVYYYRIHSPVILIEFDHESPVGLRHLFPPGVPYREHIHSVVRTPNGNDYGKDLLRQHYEKHPH
jgi:hypothetical protein